MILFQPAPACNCPLQTYFVMDRTHFWGRSWIVACLLLMWCTFLSAFFRRLRINTHCLLLKLCILHEWHHTKVLSFSTHRWRVFVRRDYVVCDFACVPMAILKNTRKMDSIFLLLIGRSSKIDQHTSSIFLHYSAIRFAHLLFLQEYRILPFLFLLPHSSLLQLITVKTWK